MNKDYLLALLISLAIFLACREGIFQAVADDTQLLWWFNQRAFASDDFLEYLDNRLYPKPDNPDDGRYEAFEHKPVHYIIA